MLRVFKYDLFCAHNDMANVFKILVGVFMLCDLHYYSSPLEKAVIAALTLGLFWA